MAVRKRCKHAAGKTGSAKTRAWRQCSCAWGTDIYVDGVRTWKNLGHDEQSARIADAQLRLDVMQGKRVRRAVGAEFSALADDWFAERAAAPDARPATLAAYRTRLKHAKAFLGDIPVSDIRQHHVNALVDAFTKEIGAPTASHVAILVGAIIKWAAVHRGIDPPNVTFQGIAKQSRRQPSDTLTIPDLQAVINALPEPFDSMAEFALLTGLRRGEILALTVQDVEDHGVKVHGNWNVKNELGPTKTAAGNRLVTFTPRTREIIDARVKAVGDGRLWPVGLNTAGWAMTKAMRAAGVHIQGKGWHAFRHAHTALLNESGVSLRDSAARLGHGANYAQSLAYGWASEQVDATAVDAAVKRHEKKK